MFHDFMFGGMWFTWIFWIVVLVLVFWFITNQLNKSKQDSKNNYSESPLDILKKRYAKGELSKEEFETMKNDLK